MSHGSSSCISGPSTTPANWQTVSAPRSTTSTSRTAANVHARSLMLAVFALLSSTIAARAATDTSAPLVLERKITLQHVSGRIDHMAIDLARKRLFVAELG